MNKNLILSLLEAADMLDPKNETFEENEEHGPCPTPFINNMNMIEKDSVNIEGMDVGGDDIDISGDGMEIDPVYQPDKGTNSDIDDLFN